MSLLQLDPYLVKKIDMVQEFHQLVGHPVGKPTNDIPSDAYKRLVMRYELILSELLEEQTALTLIDQFDAVVDIQYVVYGLLVELGLVEVFLEIIEYNDLDYYFRHNEHTLLTQATLRFCYNILYSIAETSSSSVVYVVFQAIHDNNLTKVCYTEEEAIQSIESYKKKGVNAYYEVRSNNAKSYYIILREDGKVLKPVSYKPVKLESVIVSYLNATDR